MLRNGLGDECKVRSVANSRDVHQSRVSRSADARGLHLFALAVLWARPRLLKPLTLTNRETHASTRETLEPVIHPCEIIPIELLLILSKLVCS